MMSSSKFFGVILSCCLMLSASACVVMEPADEADYVEAEWAEELQEEAVEQGYQATDEATDEPGDPSDLPDPFCDGQTPCGPNGGGTGG